ncbi:hypothetical protein [Bacillus sp. SG-1]|uniref:hypothetical protein n=1 Tax=Bacillus sp. SG-1 TaxID=161544 RepID=UPI0001545439|nr:hypothetical protein [Bacillus sp. SG-1]EDL62997.1 hypothetical protein BSG1_06062 [Bacillus sp. SG-1]
MKRVWPTLIILPLIVLTACANPAPKITQKQAESIVIESNTSTIGEVTITSVNHKRGKYIIIWENEENCESGSVQVDDQHGGILKAETTIC